MPVKRKSDAISVAESSSAKKARIPESSTPSSLPLILCQGKETLSSLPHATLVRYVTELQSAYLSLNSQSTPKPVALLAASRNTVEDPVKVEAQVEKLAEMMASGIKKQMKWQCVSILYLILSRTPIRISYLLSAPSWQASL